MLQLLLERPFSATAWEEWWNPYCVKAKSLFLYLDSCTYRSVRLQTFSYINYLGISLHFWNDKFFYKWKDQNFFLGSNVKIQYFDNFLRFLSRLFFFFWVKDTIFNDLAFPNKLSNKRSHQSQAKYNLVENSQPSHWTRSAFVIQSYFLAFPWSWQFNWYEPGWPGFLLIWGYLDHILCPLKR